MSVYVFCKGTDTKKRVQMFTLVVTLRVHSIVYIYYCLIHFSFENNALRKVANFSAFKLLF